MGCSIPSQHRKSTYRSNGLQIVVQPNSFVIENDHKFHDIYRLGKLLGTGSFGEVRCCVNRDTSLKRAVKIIRKDLLTSPKQRETLDNEVKILKSLDHPGIVRVFEYFEEVKRLYIVTEYCQGGELFTELAKQKTISEYHSACIMKQIFSVLEYLHTQEVIHRDIKPENILLEEKHNVLSIKIIDFGSAVKCPNNARLGEFSGTLHYMSPEVLLGDYNYLCDLWSAGVILYALLSGNLPFNGKNCQEMLADIEKTELFMEGGGWEQVSQCGKELISSLLCAERSRSSSTKALGCEWIKMYSSPQKNEEKLNFVLRNLQKFRAHHLLKDAIKTFMTIQYLTSADEKDLKEVFLVLDKDCDGKISYKELLNEYCKIVSEKEAEKIVKRILDEVDSDRNGFIDYSEFLRANVDHKKIISEENLRNAFKLFDQDDSGKISSIELGNLLEGSQLTNYQIWDKIIKEFDVNGDGEIDLDEFGLLLKSLSEAESACILK